MEGQTCAVCDVTVSTVVTESPAEVVVFYPRSRPSQPQPALFLSDPRDPGHTSQPLHVTVSIRKQGNLISLPAHEAYVESTRLPPRRRNSAHRECLIHDQCATRCSSRPGWRGVADYVLAPTACFWHFGSPGAVRYPCNQL